MSGSSLGVFTPEVSARGVKREAAHEGASLSAVRARARKLKLKGVSNAE